MAKATNPKDPRFRHFRALTYGVYLVVVVVFCALVIWSVFRSVAKMTPERPRNVETILTIQECSDRAQQLWERLDAQRRGFSAEQPVKDVALHWETFRLPWLRDLRDLEARCAFESHNRKALKKVFEELDHLMSLYTTHAVQYAGEIGPSVDKFRKDLKAARSSERR